MSYQPPGPYPVFPQQQQQPYGMPAKPPIPATVQRAFVLMLVGAGLAIVNAVLSFLFEHQVSQKIDAAINAGQQVTNNSVTIASGAVGGIVGVGLWTWMAFANRAGHNWARITGTVFFGISCLSLLGDIAAFGLVSRWLGGGVMVVLVIAGVVSWLVGLATLILLWRRESSAYFQPRPAQPPYPGYGYPGMPPGYMPGAPMQPGDVQQQPGDPWATPGAQD
jgi:hypothetical protein